MHENDQCYMKQFSIHGVVSQGVVFWYCVKIFICWSYLVGSARCTNREHDCKTSRVACYNSLSWKYFSRASLIYEVITPPYLGKCSRIRVRNMYAAPGKMLELLDSASWATSRDQPGEPWYAHIEAWPRQHDKGGPVNSDMPRWIHSVGHQQHF